VDVLGKGLFLCTGQRRAPLNAYMMPPQSALEISELATCWLISFARYESSGIGQGLLFEKGKTIKLYRNAYPSLLIQ